MDTLKLFGKRIKELRKKNGYTQEQLSEKLGLFQKQIGNIETGTCFTTINNLEKLSEIFELDIKDLFDFQHLKSRKMILDEIDKLLEASTDNELQTIYRIINSIKK